MSGKDPTKNERVRTKTSMARRSIGIRDATEPSTRLEALLSRSSAGKSPRPSHEFPPTMLDLSPAFSGRLCGEPESALLLIRC